jgi:hypothetical protein
MFGGRLVEAYLAAAREYLDGGWFPRAEQMAGRAKELDPNSPEADQLLQKLEQARAARRV